jgi:REP element-mobilizing transposase RayT
MPRYARINVPLGIYHIISRTLRREYLIKGAEERLYYLRQLGQATRHTDAQVLGWCLMSNHVHLVVRAGKDPLKRLMKPVHTGFGGWLSKRIGKGGGAVLGDRYKSVLVEEEEYLFQLIRYVHNNPVRAGVVSNPEDSVWSSHREYLGLEAPPEWLKAGYVLSMFSEDLDEARELFHRFVLEGKGEGRRPDLCGEGLKNMGREVQSGLGDGWRVSGPILGSKAFAAKVLSDITSMDATAKAVSSSDIVPLTAPDLDDLIDAVCAVLNLERWEFDQQPKCRAAAAARRIVAYLWVQRYKQSQTALARRLCVSTGAVSRWYSKAVREITEIEHLCEEAISRLPEKKQKKTKTAKRTTRYNLQLEDG